MVKSLKNEDILLKLAHQIPGAIFQCQIFPDSHFCFPFSSKGIWDLFEVSSEELAYDGTIILNRISDNELSKFINSIKRSSITLSQWEYDYSVNLPKKGLRWLRGIAQPERQADGSTIWNGYIIDVTERKLAARALIQKEQRWHFALESSEEGIWDYSFQNKEFYLSHKLIEKLGYTTPLKDNSAEFWFKKIHAQDICKFKIDIRKHVKGETKMFVNENRMICRDGSYKWILHKGKIIEWDENGNPLRMIGTHSDISEKKERELQQEKHLKVISDQNSRLSNFAYIVSHNLRTHTGNLELLINFIENAATEEEKQVEFEYLKTVSSQLSETIFHLNEVLSIQNSNEKNIKTLNLFLFAEKTKTTLFLAIENKQAIIKNTIPYLLEINYNPAYLESILYNLLSNSLKYSSDKRQPEITLSFYQEKDFGVLKIQDNGLGLNINKHKNDIFGMYKTFHGNKDAKGIGLFITKNQIESMGGKIEVESKEGEGSTFYVYFKI